MASHEITFHGMSPSPALEAAAVQWIARLARVHDRIQHVHVWIDLPHRHHRHGAHFEVRIAIAVPGAEIAVVRDHADPYLAVADGFLAARRQLVDRAHILRGRRARVALDQASQS